MGLGPVSWAASALSAVTQLQTVGLLMIVWLIIVMSSLMKETGHTDRLVETFTHLSRDPRTVGSVMSALIGILPMPGGALFSAPMVETALSRECITGDQKTALNYWFRHVWEYWWPLYPCVVLAVALLEVETWQYMAIMAPMTLVAVLAGIVFVLRPIGRRQPPGGKSFSPREIGAFLWEMLPILIVVFVIIAQAVTMRVLALQGLRVKIPGAVSVLPGLAAATLWVCVVNRVPLRQLRSAATGKGVLSMLLLILSIMVFKGIMIESQAVVQIRNELMAYRIPLVVVIMAMPFLAGFVTGISIAFVGTTFPLIIPMFHTAQPLHYLSYAALAFTFGFMGTMLSPVHLCFLVTKDYFKASLYKSYRLIFLPVLTVMGSAVALFLISQAL
jgi:integral membrane protein (TIGR00529 family)